MSVNIPSELILSILSHVPAECLLRFRCVCKAWCRLIDDPYFIKIHRERVHDASSRSDDVIHLLHLNSNNQLCSLSLDLLNFVAIYSKKKFETRSIIPRTMWNRGEYFVSCNGLILTYHYRKSDCWSIRNPLTHEIHSLPRYDDGDVKTNSALLAIGFGYDCVADDYKIVKHSLADDFSYSSHKFESFIYSMKSNSWKRINTFSNFISHWTNGVFCNGALHWIVKRRCPVPKKIEYIIVAYDLGIEDIRFYSLPPTSMYDSLKSSVDLHLGELDGCLSLSLYYKSFEIWLMNDNGEENLWSMLYSYANSEKYPMGSLTTISYLKSKEFLLLKLHNNEFLLVDLKNNTTKTLSIPNSLYIFPPQIFLPSLVRINGAKNKREHGYQT